MLLINFRVCFFLSSSVKALFGVDSEGNKGGIFMSFWISGGICLGNLDVGTDSCSGSSSTRKARSTALIRAGSLDLGSILSLFGAKPNVSFPGVKLI